MSSSERFSSGESDDESLPDLQKLKPYDLEPEILSLDGISTSSDEEELSSSDCEAESRIGKTYSYFKGRNFRGFVVFSQIRESLFPQNFSKDVIRESFFPRKFLSAKFSKKVTICDNIKLLWHS